MKRQSSISKRLFKSYGILFGVFFSVVFLAFLIYVGFDVNRKVIMSQETAFDTVVKRTEDFFYDMYDFSRMLSNSMEFKEIAIHKLPEAYHRDAYQGEYFKQLYLIGNRMLVRKYQIGVQLKSGEYIWLGSNYFIKDIPASSNCVFQKTGQGNLKIQMEEENQLLKATGEGIYFINVEEPCISLKRDLTMYYNSYAPVGILDIRIPYSELEEMMDDIVYSSDMNITIYNREGKVLYGIDQDNIEIHRDYNTVLKEKYEKNGKKVQIEPLLNSNLYIVGSISKGRLYKPVVIYLVSVIVLFLMLGVGLLLFTHRLSVKITSPIKMMCTKIRKIDFDGDNWTEYEPVYCDVDELNFLSDTIVYMQNKLKVSMGEAIRFRNYEVQSRMLALQAQMQPHFLYNTLMNISAIAEEKEDYEVARICVHLTRMLRYISSEDAKGVQLSKELGHLQDYVECMKERFPETEVVYDIPLEMMNIVVPKLVVQPLVENSLKYGNRLDCRIQVMGEMEGNRFKLTILDNGVGFTEEKVEEIMEHCRRLLETEEISGMKIDGMGLANIYARLYLFYGKDMLFHIYNNGQEGQGSRIEIGGVISRERQDKR